MTLQSFPGASRRFKTAQSAPNFHTLRTYLAHKLRVLRRAKRQTVTLTFLVLHALCKVTADAHVHSQTCNRMIGR